MHVNRLKNRSGHTKRNILLALYNLPDLPSLHGRRAVPGENIWPGRVAVCFVLISAALITSSAWERMGVVGS